jgi:hypothetical protein
MEVSRLLRAPTALLPWDAMSLRPQQISHGMVWDRTGIFAVRGPQSTESALITCFFSSYEMVRVNIFPDGWIVPGATAQRGPEPPHS